MLDVLWCVQGIAINSSYCGEAEQNGPLVGTIPLESSARIVFHGTRLTAVALTDVDDQTVVFLGTSSGHLKKVRSSTVQYSRPSQLYNRHLMYAGNWLVSWLEFNVPFQHKYGYIRDEVYTGYKILQPTGVFITRLNI